MIRAGFLPPTLNRSGSSRRSIPCRPRSRLRRPPDLAPGRQVEVAQPAEGGGADSQAEQVALGVAGAGAEHAQLGPGLGQPALQEAPPRVRVPEGLGVARVLADRLAQLAEQAQ